MTLSLGGAGVSYESALVECVRHKTSVMSSRRVRQTSNGYRRRARGVTEQNEELQKVLQKLLLASHGIEKEDCYAKGCEEAAA